VARRWLLVFLAVTGCTTNGGRREPAVSASADRRKESVSVHSNDSESTDARSTLSPAEKRIVGTYVLGAGLPTYATLRIYDRGLYAESFGSCVGHATSDFGTWQLEDDCIVLRSSRPVSASAEELVRRLTIGEVGETPVLIDGEHVAAVSLEGPTATNCYQRQETIGSGYWGHLVRPSIDTSR
jgi:hypothetical protein